MPAISFKIINRWIRSKTGHQLIVIKAGWWVHRDFILLFDFCMYLKFSIIKSKKQNKTRNCVLGALLISKFHTLNFQYILLLPRLLGTDECRSGRKQKSNSLGTTLFKPVLVPIVLFLLIIFNRIPYWLMYKLN